MSLEGAWVDRSIADVSTDYARVREAIVFLRGHHAQQPDLATLAAHLGLSEVHVQKLFRRWAGISPKRVLQFLTVEYAKSCMAETGDLLTLSPERGGQIENRARGRVPTGGGSGLSCRSGHLTAIEV
jgi:AraC-like DNA-binding protein